MQEGYVPLNVNWLSGMPYVRRRTTVADDGSQLVTTSKVVDGQEYDVQHHYVPGNPPPFNLLPFTRR